MTARTYVHLPTEVEAVQWTGNRDDLPDAWRASGAITFSEGTLIVLTGKGPADVNVGDFIVRSPWEEFWPIAEVKFLSSYQAKS